MIKLITGTMVAAGCWWLGFQMYSSMDYGAAVILFLVGLAVAKAGLSP